MTYQVLLSSFEIRTSGGGGGGGIAETNVCPTPCILHRSTNFISSARVTCPSYIVTINVFNYYRLFIVFKDI